MKKQTNAWSEYIKTETLCIKIKTITWECAQVRYLDVYIVVYMARILSTRSSANSKNLKQVSIHLEQQVSVKSRILQVQQAFVLDTHNFYLIPLMKLHLNG